MTDKETIQAMLDRAGVKYDDERNAITVVSNYTTIFRTQEDKCVHTLFHFNDDGSLKVCRGYYGEDY